MKHYFLTGEPWIPVVRLEGTPAEVSLLELFGEGARIVDLSLSPAERVAIMRLLLCIVARSLPLPQTRHEWQSCKERIAPQAIAYLKQWSSAFDLYGDTPFLQAVGLEKTGTATLDKLDFTLASGGNHTLFDHLATASGRPHSPAWQARMLLVTQNFSPGGTVGPNSWNGAETNKLAGNISSPALEGSPLHAFLLGEDILDTLHLNLIPREELGEMPSGVPVWEEPPANPRDARKFRETLLGRLAPFSRAIKLPEEGTAVTLAVGCNYAQLPEFIDPYLAHRRYDAKKDDPKQREYSYIRVQPDRHPWRELESLLAARPQTTEMVTPPKNLKNRSEVSSGNLLRLWCGGVAVDKAKYEFSGEWLFTFPAQVFSREDTWRQLGIFTKEAETLARHIQSSIGMFWDNLSAVMSSESVKIKAGREKAQSLAVMNYWKQLDLMATEWIASNCAESLSDMRRRLGAVVEKTFLNSLPGDSPRGMMALAQTMPYFRKGLKTILNLNLSQEKGTEEHEQ